MPQYVGLSLKDARAALGATVKSGARQDGTRLHPKLQTALGNLSTSLDDAELREATHYVVCFSEGCIIVIDHLPPPPPIDLPR